MSQELIAIIAVGVSVIGFLAGFIQPSLRELRRDVAGLRERVANLETRFAHLEERMARLEGFFESFTRNPPTSAQHV